MLTDKRLLITSVVTTNSIAFATALRAQQLGAEIVLPRLTATARSANGPPTTCPLERRVLPLVVNQADDFIRLTDDLCQRWGRLDGALHAVAFAPRDALAGDFLNARPEGVGLAFRTWDQSGFTADDLSELPARVAAVEGGRHRSRRRSAHSSWSAPGHQQ